MTSEDLKSELERDPFIPVLLHMVSGKVFDVPFADAGWLLQNSVLIFRKPHLATREAEGYDVISLRNIERIEQRPPTGRSRRIA